MLAGQSILAGQTLAAASVGGNLSITVGIVVSVIISLVLSFSGIRVLHFFERYSWLVVLPVFVALTAVAGSGPDGLHIPAEEPALAPRPVLSMGSLLAGYLISWSIMSTDYSLYLEPRTSPVKLFTYVWSGFFFSTSECGSRGALRLLCMC
jgi:purine-cytosine permease-like protein